MVELGIIVLPGEAQSLLQFLNEATEMKRIHNVQRVFARWGRVTVEVDQGDTVTSLAAKFGRDASRIAAGLRSPYDMGGLPHSADVQIARPPTRPYNGGVAIPDPTPFEL